MPKLGGKSSAIGYKRPPAHTRFVKGKSGNPKGRPKGTGAADGLARLVNQPVTVTLDGRQQKVPLSEALVLGLAQRGLGGNVVATREFIKIADKVKAERKAAEQEDEVPSFVTFRLTGPAEDCNDALQKLGVIELYEDRWRICTWVVEEALERDRERLANENDRQVIANNMMSPEALPAILARSG